MATRMIDRGELAWRLQQLRAFSRCTLRTVELDAGVPHSTLSRLEKGIARLDLEALAKLCLYYTRFTRAEVVLIDLLDPDYDTRVWLNAAA